MSREPREVQNRRQRHMHAKRRAEHPDRILCEECGVYFVGVRGMRTHRGRWHGGQLPKGPPA